MRKKNKKTERQEKFLDRVLDKYSNDPEENIFPKPMTDAEFVKVMTDYFLGEGWYVVDPMSHEQINVARAVQIIEKINIKK
jgi:hypothetical protein